MRQGEEGKDRLQEEEIQGKPYDARLMRRLLTYLSPHWRITFLSVGVLMAGSLLELAGPYLTKVAIDDHIRLGDWSGLHRIALIYLGVLLASFFLQYLRVTLMQLAGQRVIFDLRTEVFRHLLRMPMRFFDGNPVGRLITRLVNDIEALSELFTQGIITLFGDLFLLLGIAVALVLLHWELGLVALSITPVLAFLMALYRRKARDAYRKVRWNVARMNAFLQEGLTGMTTVQLFRREETQFHRFDRMNGQTRNELLRSIRYNALFFPSVEVLAYTAIGLVIWYGGGQVIQMAILPGVLVAFIQYLRLFFQPIRDLAEKYNLLQAAMASSERIFHLLDAPDAETMDPPSRRNIPLPLPVRGEVRFEAVWFGYDPREPVLKGISFHIEPGERVAIVGATGAGKTSLIQVLCRFYEIQKGRIRFDGIDIRHLDRLELRRSLAICLQDVFLFQGTIEENIRLNRPWISEEEVRRAARWVHAHRFIESLPEGYKHLLKERGSNLSLGQRQLLAFARALVTNPPLLVLDEATSSVDTETERILQEALLRLIEGRTALIIAHRLSTIRMADRILVLHGGKIREEGTHEELLKKGGIYHKLYEMSMDPDPLWTRRGARG